MTITKRRAPIPLDVKIDEYREMLGHIIKNGGYASEAMKDLGLTVKLHDFRVFAAEQGVVLKDYALAWKRYGNWITLPGPYKSEGKTRYIVPAICLLCGKRFELNLINAKTSKTRSCQSCSTRTRASFSVLDEDSGTTFRSIRSWVMEIGMMKRYQQLRIQIRAEGRVKINDQWYSIVESKD